MPDRNQSFPALILRAKDSPSGDRIVSLLSADEGIVDAFVFGGARSSLPLRRLVLRLRHRLRSTPIRSSITAS